MMPGLQSNAAGHVQHHALELIRVLGINAMTSTKVTEITPEGVIVQKADGSTQLIKADTVLYSVGFKANTALYDSLARCGTEIYNIGDSDNVSNVLNAVHAAYNLVNRL